jgi:hypothetical protein
MHDTSKAKIDPVLKSFQTCAEQAGAIVASRRDRLASLVPETTLAIKNDFHRWIFAVYDLAWSFVPERPLRPEYQRLSWSATTEPKRGPRDAPLRSNRYIPLGAFNRWMERDETLLYDEEYLRSLPWSDVRARLIADSLVEPDFLEAPYRSWQERLPEYFSSRFHDIALASIKALDRILKRIDEPESM